jgi:hypothetical protein
MKRILAAACLSVELAVVGLAVAQGQQASSAAKCGNLARLALAHTSIVRAEVTEAGKLNLPDADKDPVFAKMPAFCRVVVDSHPTADSKIAIEVWLPLEGWNGRFLGVGNGGFAGQIDFHHLAVAVSLGYASAGTDTGHIGSGIDATWALGHPEKIADFGWRGVHEMSLTAQGITLAFYGRPASHRYFDACSDGGREALMEAQRFPADYDGILAGAPAYHWTHLLTGALVADQALEGKPESYIPAAKLPAISDAVLAQCTQKGGDAFLDDPRRCRFDPSALLCRGADSNQCLTTPQVTALKALYAGPHKKDGTPINPGAMPGAELGGGGWEPWITGPAPQKSAMTGFATGYFDDMVYDKAGIDVRTLDPDAAFDLAVNKTARDLDATDADLSAFAALGGKLILYHGWNDPAIPALGTIDYYNSVVAKAGETNAASFVRLFLVPGMQHCSGGPGIASFGQGGPSQDPESNDAAHNIHRALEAWVETGAAPDKVIASKTVEKPGEPKTVLTRPLCPYPRAAQFSGAGDRNSAASYVCAAAR